jgi:hypothetical protein
MQSRFSAWVKSTDISNLIRAADLDPFVITESPPIVADDAGYLAKWTAQRIIGVPLTPGSQRKLTVRYTARPATLAILCKPNGEFAVVRGQTKLQARPDAHGTLHVLTLHIPRR